MHHVTFRGDELCKLFMAVINLGLDPSALALYADLEVRIQLAAVSSALCYHDFLATPSRGAFGCLGISRSDRTS